MNQEEEFKQAIGKYGSMLTGSLIDLGENDYIDTTSPYYYAPHEYIINSIRFAEFEEGNNYDYHHIRDCQICNEDMEQIRLTTKLAFFQGVTTLVRQATVFGTYE